MKVSEAPEKIYLFENPIEGTPDYRWLSKRSSDEDIEYTRTDALIEKMCNLLDKMIWEVTYEDLEGNSTQHYDKMEFIEEFKNYIKGE
jgi:hypothetical protein